MYCTYRLTLHSARPHNPEWEKGGRGPGGPGGRGRGEGHGPTRPRGPGGRGGPWVEGSSAPEGTRQPFHLAPRMATGAVGAMPKKTARKKIVPETPPAE